MAQIKGTVVKITFQNEESGFTVLKLKDETSAQQHVCVGVMPAIECGETIQARGEWANNKRFGLQFTVEAYELCRPATIEGIYALLSSGLIASIGPVRAKKIIDKFGAGTLTVLDTDPHQLTQVPGIGKKRLENIISGWQKHTHIKELMLFLQEHNITLNFIYKIYKAYGQKSREVISANPYRLIDDIWGVGFKKADTIARKFGYAENSYRRIRAGIIHTLQEAAADGHVYLPRPAVVEKAAGLLCIPQEKIIYSIDHAAEEKVVIAENGRLYLPVYYYAEADIAAMICERMKQPKRSVPGCSEAAMDEWLRAYGEKNGWAADPKQLCAIKAAVHHNILLLTGGPGTGKTTTLKVMVSFFRKNNLQVTLAAPTGRAAQRMGTIAGLHAQTIHRLLEFNPRMPGQRFARNKDNPVTTDVLICDEVSMIDTLLMQNLLAALLTSTVVIFVGDSNQLPSVGAGNILADLIRCQAIPHVRLTTVFRQAAQSRIITAAHEIIHGTTPALGNEKLDNCFFLQKDDPQECLDLIIDLVANRLPARYHIDPVNDIQVLSPMHRGILGTQSINRLLQKKLNRSELKITRGETEFCLGDKVMQIRNNYDNGVFNGDIGFIATIADNLGCVVDFGDKTVTYETKDLDELEHAYCISVHKSQGCEFNTVVIPVTTQHYIMLQRNLIYTALTRAKKLCIMAGSLRGLHIAVKNDRAFQRYSHLSDRIREKENFTVCGG